MMRCVAVFAERARREDGFTIVEAMVASLLLIIGVLGTLQLFDTGTRNTYRAEESQVINDRLQAELEAVRQLPFDQVALTSTPAHVPNANDPRSRISGTKYLVDRGGTVASGSQLVVNGGTSPTGEGVAGGVVEPGPTPFTAGDVKGEIFRFVTWADDPNCGACGQGAMKRVVVAARIDEAAISHERTFQEVQTDVVDYDATPDDNQIPPDDDSNDTSAQFWLTDTTCDSSARVPTTSDHNAHNTRGLCSDGAKTGNTRGAPDLMFTKAPSLEDSPGTELYDYALDSNYSPVGRDAGLLMERSSAGSCLLQPALNLGDLRRILDGLGGALNLGSSPSPLAGVLDLTDGLTNKHHRMHTWVTPPIGNPNGAVLTGRGTLELFTRSVGGASHAGEICAWMFVRQQVTVPRCLVSLLGVCVPVGDITLDVDIPLLNVGLLANGECRTGIGANLTNFQFARNPWPTDWEKISMPMCFTAVNGSGVPVETLLPKNSRLGLTLLVKSGGPANSLEFMYDRVGFESRLEVQTKSLLSFGS